MVTIEPPAIASTETLFAPSLGYTISLPSVGSGETLFAPTLVPGEVTLSPPAIASGETLFAHAVALGNRAGQRHAECLLAQEALIPKELQPFNLLFFGTRWRDSGHYTLVP